MRALATAMLAGMAAIFIAATGLDGAAPGLGLRPRLRRGRGWSAASPTGSRSPPCSATRSACRSRTPRSCRATRTGSATRSPTSSRTISSPPRWSRGGCASSTSPARSAASSPSRRARGGCARAARACSPTSWRRSIRSGSAAWSRPRSPSACARSRSRPCSARRWRRRSPRSGTCRWSTGSSPGPAARSTPMRI